MAEKSAKRKKAEKSIIDLMDSLDPTGFNSKRYKDMFKTMSNPDFEKMLKGFMIDDPNKFKGLYFQINSSNRTPKQGYPTIESIAAVAKKFNHELTEHIVYPFRNPDNPMVSLTPMPILTLPVRKLVQMLEKKNAAVSNIDVTNPLTGQVTGDSKAASMTDTQVMSLLTTKQTSVIREMLQVRSDNFKAKTKMMRTIERDGEFALDDLNINHMDAQSNQTMIVMFAGAMFATKFE